MRAYPTRVLAVQDRISVVVNPLVCGYGGLCETVCQSLAISRPFKIFIVCNEEEQARSK